ncbi:MAG TPA: pyruvate dehydrogenase complex dihydrolipoamide acetyltransferase [Stellaceae bacterium]|nr:pyruvate dehydrogenase complex dihydrolipoamide acetyltransferase [Stellaceae bacterium]
MPIEVLMPALSPTMTEGNLAKWHKKVGDAVKAGDLIAEIETDKATMEVEAVDEGVVGELVVPEGAQGVKVNAVIARLLGEGEDKAALKSATKPEPKAAPAPAPKPQAAAPAPQPAQAKPSSALAPTPAGDLAANGADRVFASPLARRMAAQAGVDIARLRGSGPHGRIVKADIDAAFQGGAPPRAPSTATAAVAPKAPPMAATPSMAQVAALAGNAPYTPIPHTTMRRTIARRLTEVQQSVPVFYLTVDCEIDALLKARADVNAQAESKISVNDFVIKAAALALKKVPAVNASWSEDAVLRWTGVDVSVAVALDDGLITPIIRTADQKGLAQISAEMKDLATRAKANKLRLEEFQGGTFSISNLGMFGVSEFTAVINPPQSCILAVAAGVQQPVVRDGVVAIATVMRCTISCDHRVVDGATSAKFMNAFKKYIESPVTMLL